MIATFWNALADGAVLEHGVGQQQLAGNRTAWVTFVDGSDWVLGAVVLGRSIRAHALVERKQIVLVAGLLEELAISQLENAGWTPEFVPTIHNPNARYPHKLAKVYSKLAVFGLPGCERVVYLDVDTLIISRRAEALFECPAKLCAVLRHSERFNSGLLSLQPEPETLLRMRSMINSTESYTLGDQGYLNTLYPEMAAAPLWHPGDDSGRTSSGGDLLRLPTSFNADWGLFVLSNKWPVAENELAVLHYTLGPLKPWAWFAGWLAPEATAAWRAARNQAGVGLLGWASSPAHQALSALLFFAAASGLSAAVACRGRRLLLCSGGCSGGPASAWLAQSSDVLLAAAPAAVVAAGAVAVAVATVCCPRRAQPGIGLLLWLAFTTAVWSLLCGSWLALVYTAGRAAPMPSSLDVGAAALHRTGRSWIALLICWSLLPLVIACFSSGLLIFAFAAVGGASALACFAASEARPIARLWLAAGASAAAAKEQESKQV